MIGLINDQFAANMKKYLIIIIIFFAVPDLSAQGIKLQFNPEPGYEYSMLISANSVIQQEVMGIEQAVSVEMEMVMNARFIAKTDSFTEMELRYRDMIIKSQSPVLSLSLSSESVNPSPEEIMLKEIVNKAFTAKVDRQGHILEVSGLEKIMENLGDYPGMDESNLENMRNSIQESFGEESIIQNLQQTMPVFPHKLLQEGDSWKYAYNTSTNNINIIQYNTASVVELTGNNILIRINGKLQSNDQNFQNFEGFRARIDLKGTQISEMLIDKNTGISIESVTNQNINGIIRLKISDEPGDTMDMPVSIKSRISMKRQK